MKIGPATLGAPGNLRREARGVLVPALLIVAALAAILYGVLCHAIPVIAEKGGEGAQSSPPAPGAETKGRPSPAAAPQAPESKAQESPLLQDESFLASLPTGPSTETAPPAEGPAVLSEPQAIRAVTVGALQRQPSGEIKQTAGAAQCPT